MTKPTKGKAPKTRAKKAPKPKKIETVDVAATQTGSVIDNDEFKFDPKTMEHVNVEFLDNNTVTSANAIFEGNGGVIVAPSRPYTILPTNINLENHDELSKPEKYDYTWVFWLIIPSCLLAYALGVATAFLYTF